MTDMARIEATRLQVRYVGRVQGVGFRATCKDIARGHPVSGWVRNHADGSVLLEAQGDAASVEVFLRAIDATMARYIQQAARMPVSLVEQETGFVIRK